MSAGLATPPPPPAPGAGSAFEPLRDATFRMLWLAWLTANMCMWMNDVAAAWMMTSLAPDPVWVALVQSAATLPVFLLGLPSGAMADLVDRRRWFMATQLWVAGCGSALAMLAFAGALNAPLLLLLTFANGIGLAARWPVFAAIVPSLVSRDQLTAALGLNAIAMNASRIGGPVIAGALIASFGSAYVFALNAVLSVGAAMVIARWRSAPSASALPGERFVGAMRVGLKYVRQSPRMRVVLLRIFVFFLQSTALVALLPLLAKNLEGGGAGAYTLLLACMGMGAIAISVWLPRLRDRLTPDQMVHWGTLTHALCTVAMAFVPSAWWGVPAMLAGGAAWIAVANSLTVAAQLALPDWVRARGMSIYQMALMAGSAGGAALWGQVASLTTLRTGLLLAAGLSLLLLIVLRRQRVGAHAEEDFTPQKPGQDPVAAPYVQPEDGPVLVTVEYVVDEADIPAFTEVMRESRRSRLQQGVLSWGLFRDGTDPRRWIEYFVDENWIEHLRRFDRLTAAHAQLRERRLAFHRGDSPPTVKRYVGQSVVD